MPEITLVRQDPVQVTEADKAVARRVIFGIVDAKTVTEADAFNSTAELIVAAIEG